MLYTAGEKEAVKDKGGYKISSRLKFNLTKIQITRDKKVTSQVKSHKSQVTSHKSQVNLQVAEKISKIKIPIMIFHDRDFY
jgi:hypothetical protein